MNDFPTDEITVTMWTRSASDTPRTLLSYVSTEENRTIGFQDFAIYDGTGLSVVVAGKNGIGSGASVADVKSGVSINDGCVNVFSSLFEQRFFVLTPSFNILFMSLSHHPNMLSRMHCEYQPTFIYSYWHFIAITWRRAGGELEIWTDGHRAFVTSSYQADAVIRPGGYLVIGQMQIGACEGHTSGCTFQGGRGHVGDVQNVRLWNYVRSASELAAEIEDLAANSAILIISRT